MSEAAGGAAGATAYVCVTCRGSQPEDLAALRARLATAGLADQVAVAPVGCLRCCDDPNALTLEGEGRAGYVFAGLDLAADAADIVATCRAYLEAPGGWIEDARPCGRLRLLLRARLPARDLDSGG